MRFKIIHFTKDGLVLDYTKEEKERRERSKKKVIEDKKDQEERNKQFDF